jgi:hypothetical protein
MEPTKQQIKQDQIDNFNKTDIRTKEWRDQNTSTHSFVADINHTLEEMGQRGFSFSKMNSLMGGQIAQHARTIGDRRYLGLLDEIETPGGSWGNTQEGLKLKQVTWDQIDADENQKVRNERAKFLHAKEKLVHGQKAEIGVLLSELRSAKPKDKPAIQEKIDAILSSSRELGVGTEIYTYHGNMVKGMEGGTAGGSTAIRGYDDIANPDLDPNKTIRQIQVEALQNNLSDNTLDQRKQIINESTNGWYVTLDKEGQEQANKLITDFRKIADIPELKKSKTRLTKLFKNRELEYRKGGTSIEAKLRALRGEQTSAVPDGLTKIMNRQALELEQAFTEEYSKFSDTLEKLPIDEGAAYGYNGWSPQNKQEFNDKHYETKIEPLFKKFEDELEAYKEADKPRVEEEETHEEKYSALKNDKAPNHYLELHDMMYPEPSEGKTRVRPSNLLEKFKIAVVGLQIGINEFFYKKDAQGKLKKVVPGSIANFHKGIKGAFVADDIRDWFEKSVGDSTDPIVIKKKLKQLWEWGLYVTQRQAHYNINNNSSLSKEVKEERIKLYDKSMKAEKMPESIRDLAGGRKKEKEIIAVWDKRNPWPPKEGAKAKKKNIKEPSSEERTLFEKRRKEATESDSVIDEVLNWIFTPREKE